MFKRQTSGSCVCISCGQLISINNTTCQHCGIKNPSLWGYSRTLRQLGVDLGFTKFVIWGCLALYLATLIVDLPHITNVLPANILAPSRVSLLIFGASGAMPVFQFGFWWTVLSAGWLHGSLLHVAFNLLWFNNLSLQVAQAFGAARLVIIYTIAIISGFLLSSTVGQFLPASFHGASVGIGASGGVFGLLGALVAYGQTTKDAAVKQEAWTLAVVMFIFGVIDPQVDNWGHLGGFIGGYLVSRVPGISPQKKVGWWQIGLASGCLALTVLSILASIINAYKFGFFGLNALQVLSPN